MARRGYRVWADDAVVLSIHSTSQRVLTSLLPHRINLRPESRQFFGLEEDIDVAVETAESEDDRLAAVVVLASGPRTALRIGPLPLDAALTAVLPHAYCFFAEEGRERMSVTAYLHLVASVPVFRFSFPSGFSRFDAALDALETHLQTALAGV